MQKSSKVSIVISPQNNNSTKEDFNELRRDCFFMELTDGGAAARTMGDFLRTFGRRHIERLQDLLFEMALNLRMAIFDDKKSKSVSACNA